MTRRASAMNCNRWVPGHQLHSYSNNWLLIFDILSCHLPNIFIRATDQRWLIVVSQALRRNIRNHNKMIVLSGSHSELGVFEIHITDTDINIGSGLSVDLFCRGSGPRLNIKTVLSTYGDFHVKDKTYLRMVISMLKIRRPLGRLIFNMGIAIPGKTVFLIETAPWVPQHVNFQDHQANLDSCCIAGSGYFWNDNHITQGPMT